VIFIRHALFVQESDTPVDLDLSSGSTFLNYTYPPLPHVKFQLLCVRMLGLLVVHGVWFVAVNMANYFYAVSSLTVG